MYDNAARASSLLTSIKLAPGASSGRQRLQGRYPATSAWAAWAKKEQFFRRGVFTRQMGRQ